MHHFNFCHIVFAALLALANPSAAQTVFDFESLPVPTSGFNNGDPDLSPAERAFFENVTTTNFAPGTNFGVMIQVDQTLRLSEDGVSLSLENSFFGTEPGAGFDDFFSGFSYSNVRDSTTPGEGNRYAAFPGSGANGSDNYLAGAGDTSLTASTTILSIDIAPTTYTALAVRDGDDGGNNFVSGRLSASDGFFELIISGDNGGPSIIVPFADYRNGASLAPPTAFQTIDVSSLNSRQLTFRYDGSDRDPNFNFLNTPAFFAADNIVVASIPEPSFVCLIGLTGLATAARRRKLM